MILGPVGRDRNRPQTREDSLCAFLVVDAMLGTCWTRSGPSRGILS